MGRTSAARMGEQRQDPARTPLWRFLPLAVVIVGLAFGYAMGWHQYLTLDFLAESRDALKAAVAANYPASLAAYFILYALAVACSFPAASILTVFGGFLFGWMVAAPVVAVAATLGATALFLAARSAFGGFLRRRVRGRAASLAEGFEKDAFGYLLVLRLAPIIPFFLVNIAPALFKVPLRSFVGATVLGILPGTLVYSILGAGLDSVLVAAQAAGRRPTIGDLVTPQISLAFAGLALVAAMTIVIKKLQGRARD